MWTIKKCIMSHDLCVSFCAVEQIKQVWKEAPLAGGWLDYLQFVQIIKRGKEDE